MNKIKILSREVSDVIAAGEVVDNPSSLVKELVENSLDAGASSVDIEISNNSRNILVRDNGSGMSLEDLEICTQRHATSKITDKEDLFNISTYGFRGEALSSIAAVSRMSVSSMQEEGYRIYSDAGNIVGQEIVSMNKGTEVRIEDLFFYVPARLKFMRSIENEYSKIKAIVLREALVNPDVSVTLKVDNKVKIKTSGRGIENTIAELFGVNILKSLNKFNMGFLGDTSLQKSTKDYIFTYFNGRFAKSNIVDKAILDSYYTRLEKGKYPFVILFLEVDPKSIDVNVHPSKKVVKFTSEPFMYRFVRSELSKALDAIDRKLVTSAMSGEVIDVKKLDPIKPVKPLSSSSKSFTSNEKIHEAEEFKKPQDSMKGLDNKKIEPNTEDYFAENRFVGQIFRSFSIVECKDRIELYDNHIVQERILYEEIKEKYYNNNIVKQNLLVPIKIALLSKEKDAVLSNLDFFNNFGFEVDDFEGKDIVLRAVPLFSFYDSYANIFKDLAELISNENIKERIKDIREEAIITMSCRQSIKAGDAVKDEEMKSIINKLHKIGKYTCPHGRNIIVELSKSYLYKMFKR